MGLIVFAAVLLCGCGDRFDYVPDGESGSEGGASPSAETGEQPAAAADDEFLISDSPAEPTTGGSLPETIGRPQPDSIASSESSDSQDDEEPEEASVPSFEELFGTVEEYGSSEPPEAEEPVVESPPVLADNSPEPVTTPWLPPTESVSEEDGSSTRTAEQTSEDFGDVLASESEPPPAILPEPPAETQTEIEPAPPAPTPEPLEWAAPVESDNRYATTPIASVDPPMELAEPMESEPAPAIEPPLDPIPVDIGNTRHLAWLLGSKVSFASLSPWIEAEHGDIDPQEIVALAEVLGVDPPNEQVVYATDDSVAATIGRLLDETRTVAEQLVRRHGVDHAALVEVSVKSNVLIVLKQKSPSMVNSVLGAINDAAQRAELPPEAWRPLIDLIEIETTLEELQEAVFLLHQQVEQSLRTRVN